jgi:transcriptional regulator with XRE-family HTH domain
VNMTSVRKQLIAKFNNKEYRDAFIAEQIFTRLPLKIRFLRDAKDLTQKQLGQRAGIAQTWVSKLEDPNYGKLTISTLLKIASALDVGLQIDFVPYSRVLDAALELSPTTFGVVSFAEDAGLSHQPTSATGIVTPASALSIGTVIAWPSYAASATTGTVHTPARSASSAARQAIA